MSIPPATTSYGPYAFNMNDDLRTCLDVCNYKAATPAKLWHDQASGDSASANSGGMSFADVLDMINPLQHLPIISTIYRAITGDKPGLVSELAGGALYGGPIGLLSAGINAAFEGTTGKTDGELVASLANDVFGSGGSAGAAKPATAVAAADTTAAKTQSNPQLASIPSDAAPSNAVPPGAIFAPNTVKASAATADHPAHAAPPAYPAFKAARAFSAFTATDPRAFPARAASGATLPAAAMGDAESRRIAAKVAAQQRAQLGMILANMNAAPDATPSTPGALPVPETGSATGAAPANPYMPVPGLSPAAMRAALERYQRAVQGYAAPAANPPTAKP